MVLQGQSHVFIKHVNGTCRRACFYVQETGHCRTISWTQQCPRQKDSPLISYYLPCDTGGFKKAKTRRVRYASLVRVNCQVPLL